MPPDKVSRPGRTTGPLGPRRAIATVLRQLRESRRESLNDVADTLMISRSKLSRLETAQGLPQPRDIRDLIQYYGIQDTPQATRLQRWLTAARQPGWWTNFDYELLPGDMDVHLAYEADATVERAYTIPFVPALLQTDEYAAAIFRDMEGHAEDDVSQLLAIRRGRKDVLRDRGSLAPLQLIAVMHETALRQVVGSPEIMGGQLAALADLPLGTGVQLHVFPFSARPVFSMTCMYAYFEYQDAHVPDVVNIETHNGFITVEEPAQAARYRMAHEALVAASLPEAESRAYIRSVRKELLAT